MIYFLLKTDGTKVPIIITDEDKTSVKITNMHGDSRWIKYSDFFVVDLNTMVLK